LIEPLIYWTLSLVGLPVYLLTSGWVVWVIMSNIATTLDHGWLWCAFDAQGDLHTLNKLPDQATHTSHRSSCSGITVVSKMPSFGRSTFYIIVIAVRRLKADCHWQPGLY